ncbi:hypothetical protein MNBD_NITROSPINAE02-1789 [hydrothermal vent metagenome]|uniref:Glycosyl transferase family 1 domain-containing protein n=1 Tax=hydrothermal vent metagenome TaxID=652676 RepID=A0A3B1BZM2_9ZZZZ
MSLYRLVKNMDRSRFSNIVVSLTAGGPVRKLIENENVQVIDLGMKRGAINPEGILRLTKIIRTNQPDILQTWLYHADFLGLVATLFSGSASLVWNIRCARMDPEDYSKTLSIIIRFLARFSRRPVAVVVNSEAGKKEHEKMGYNPKRWELIHNGLDTETFKPDQSTRKAFRKELGISDKTILIGHTARFHPMKDHETFILVAAQIMVNHPSARFLMVGGGVDETNQELKNSIEEHGLADKMFLLGERSDMAIIASAFDIFVSSSAYGEGFSNSVGEAMACGVPCVVTDVGDSAMIVGKTGRVTPPRNPEALAEGCETIISMSDEERRELGKRARERIKDNFTIRRAIDKYETLYESVARAR